LFVTFHSEDVSRKGGTYNDFLLKKAKTRELSVDSIHFDDDYIWDVECLGKVLDSTEQAIKAWITQLKLSGYILLNNHPLYLYYIGDWRKRKKLAYAKHFVEGIFYVKEGLAYIRTKTPYSNDDIVWCYLGKSDGYYFWTSYTFEVSIKEGSGRVLRQHRLKKHPSGMVELRTNQQGYQVV
jgi:hypothetical protein